MLGSEVGCEENDMPLTYGLLNEFATTNILLRNVLTGVRGQRFMKIIWPITTG
jgi:hypothetical protein